MSAGTNTTGRSCDELGVCQGHALRCTRCLPPQPFAPGAIEHHTSRQRKALVRALKQAAAFMAAAVLFGLVAGLVMGASQ